MRKGIGEVENLFIIQMTSFRSVVLSLCVLENPSMKWTLL